HTLSLFNESASTETYPLPLHDALPIWIGLPSAPMRGCESCLAFCSVTTTSPGTTVSSGPMALSACAQLSPGRRQQTIRSCLAMRSEEHTSELQSLTNLVCRLLLETKKI